MNTEYLPGDALPEDEIDRACAHAAGIARTRREVREAVATIADMPPTPSENVKWVVQYKRASDKKWHTNTCMYDTECEAASFIRRSIADSWETRLIRVVLP